MRVFHILRRLRESIARRLTKKGKGKHDPIAADTSPGTFSPQDGPAPPTSSSQASGAMSLSQKPQGASPESPPLKSSSAARPIFALVIGINNYQDAVPSRLRGCINDSNSVFTYLKETLHVPEANIILLHDGQATRDKILTTFQSHFIDNPAINTDDAIIFYFAGHGSRQKAPPDWHADDDRVETICPYDVTKEFGIPDYTIANLVRKLAFKKGNNITLIFDSCHSGGMGRADDETDENAPLTRCYDPLNDLPIPADLDREIWSWTPDGGRSASQPVIPGSFPKAMEGHVLLAACQPRQQAKEAYFSGLWSGAFTNALLASLKAWNPSTTALTYSQLMENLSPMDNQNPHCEGKNKIRRLFSPSEEGRDDPTKFVVTAVRRASNDYYYVAAGYLLGIVKGTEFITHPHSGITPITLVATIVEEFRCRVEPRREQTLPGGHDDDKNLQPTPLASIIPEHSRATVSKWATKWLRVELTPRDAFPQIRDGNDTLFSIVESDGELIASLVDDAPKVVRLTRNDLLIGSQPECRCILINFDLFTNQYLDEAARFHFFLYQHRSPPLIRSHHMESSASVVLSLHRLKPALDPLGEVQFIPDGCDLFQLQSYAEDMGKELAGTAVLEGPAANKEYGFTLNNHTPVDFFPYVLYFDPFKYKIQSLYLPHSSVSRPLTRKGTEGSSLGIGYGAHGTESIMFSLPEGINHDSAFIKVFVSTVYINMELVNSERRDVEKKSRSVMECWNSWVYVVTVRQ